MIARSPLTFHRAHRIRFSECDPAGIVFYPHYFVMFNDLLEAWVDTLVPGGFAAYIGEQRLGLPTVRVEAEFRAISRMGDDVDMTLEVVRVGERSMDIEWRCSGRDGDVRMSARQTVVTTSLVTHRAIAIPQPLHLALAGARA